MCTEYISCSPRAQFAEPRDISVYCTLIFEPSSRLAFSTSKTFPPPAPLNESLTNSSQNVIPILSPHFFGKQETSPQRTQNPSLSPSAFISFLPRPRLRRPDIRMGSYNVRPGRRRLSRYILCSSLFFWFFWREFRKIQWG